MKVNIINELLNRTFIKVEGCAGGDMLRFVSEDNRSFIFYHSQDCCESVNIESIDGDLSWLENTPILMAEEVINNDEQNNCKIYQYGSFTWTFYKFATIKGYVTVRWYGESNGYYSESVNYRWI